MSFCVPGIDGRGEGISNSCLPLRWEVVVSTAHDHLNGAWGAVHSPHSLHAFERDVPDLQAGYPFIITICGHDHQVAFQSGGGNKRIDIANQSRAMRRSERTADFSIAFQDGVGEEIRIKGTMRSTAGSRPWR